MRKISADVIYTSLGAPLNDALLIINDKGKILELADASKYSKEDIEFYDGALCPGFINCHCHLELSHLKQRLPEKTGLVEFIKPIAQIRQEYSEDQILKAIELADQEMHLAGIVAVGDISNDASSFNTKTKSPIEYHTFLELFGLHPSREEDSMKHGKHVLSVLQKEAGKGSLAPHAPYSASLSLIKSIDNYNTEVGAKISSIHNQECQAESDMFERGMGGFYDFYKSEWKLDLNDFFIAPEQSSLNFILSGFKKNSKLLLVHNTFTNKKDLKEALTNYPNLYWCFCPNANLYIENRLPNFKQFTDLNAKIVLGTDSYCSNWSLSILDEMKTISKYSNALSLEELISWSCINGAEFMGLDSHLGSLEIGKSPGINLLENIDISRKKLTASSTVRKII